MRPSRIAVILAILALLALVGTAVFVYYPISITVNSVSPPVIFGLGSNANQADLAGNTIQVTLGPNSTSASLVLHPTYEKTYYHDVLRIVNPAPPNGDNYFIAIRVTSPLAGAAFVQARAYVYDNANNLLFTVDLKVAGDYGWPTALPDNTQYRVDIEIVISQGVLLPSGSVNLELIYSPQNAAAPP